MKRGPKLSHERYDLITKDGRIVKQMKTLGGALKAAQRLHCRVEPAKDQNNEQTQMQTMLPRVGITS